MALTCICEPVNGSEQDYMFCNSTTFNLTGNESGQCHLQPLDEVLFRLLGPRKSPFFFPVTFMYILIFVTGVVGNLLTCTVITKDRKMRTPTNLNLFSLAISDLLVLLFGMPLEIYELWQNYPFPFGESICCFKILLFETVCFASVLNVTVLSMERYIAVVHPLTTRYTLTKKHAQRVIGSVWAMSLLCAIPNTSLHGLQYHYLPDRVLESATCSLLKPKWMYNLVIQVTTVLFYFVPMMVISVLYLMIGLTLRKGQRQKKDKLGNSCSNDSWKIHLDSGRRRQVTKMHFVMVLVFAICWAPFHIDRLLWSFITSWTDHMYNIFEYVHIISGVLFYLSSAVNPIIYNLLSSRFRERFQALVCSRLPTSSSRNDSTPFYIIPKDLPTNPQRSG
ncbi:neuromedin-U receptor 2 isoform X1 [Myxocyprinus asiaticus]|uniref:neuromedin-U receptor 2 isoform X1 n=1 Tax=Myxocyprinus asiaticus TaxID=70543 RepID=UPI002222DB2E|nr:neuromedin-U receptor 2 isoform X1 [Myxocyprinus asiaticus]XP_051528825.1 neuromedin-U receptor 2 isoform X1 [Myxocyprinus asiaticus]XP_051528826.1 neuromedin-U receptor 2 isoform X1 [Myxocyprinus asiaticus]XP_051528828.1 neuromedin-U receptor 2 isoform X1 [Myxocyprinus asiaticus]